MHKKMRKPRTIKNGIVNIDDVTVEPGAKFEHWIPITREKLAEREAILLSKRVDLCMQCVVTAITDFYLNNESYFNRNINVEQMKNLNMHIFTESFVNNGDVARITEQCKSKIKQHLDAWKGIQRSKKVTATFRDYFKISKNWWDQRKIEITAHHFWIPIINLIVKVNRSTIGQVYSAHCKPLQECYAQYLSASTLDQLFRCMLKMANSRERLLIPAGVFLSFCNEHGGVPFFNEVVEHDENALSGKGGKCARRTILNFLAEKKEKVQVDIVHFLNNDDYLQTTVAMEIPPQIQAESVPFVESQQAAVPVTDPVAIAVDPAANYVKMEDESKLDAAFMPEISNNDDQFESMVDELRKYNESMRDVNAFDDDVDNECMRRVTESASPPNIYRFAAATTNSIDLFASSSPSPTNHETQLELQPEPEPKTCTNRYSGNAFLPTVQAQPDKNDNRQNDIDVVNTNYGEVRMAESNNNSHNTNNLNHNCHSSNSDSNAFGYNHHRNLTELDVQTLDGAQLPNLHIHRTDCSMPSMDSSVDHSHNYQYPQQGPFANYDNNNLYQQSQFQMGLPPPTTPVSQENNNSINESSSCYQDFANPLVTESMPSRSRIINEAPPPLPLYHLPFAEPTRVVVEPPYFDMDRARAPPNHRHHHHHQYLPYNYNHCTTTNNHFGHSFNHYNHPYNNNTNNTNNHLHHHQNMNHQCNYQNYHNSAYHVSSMRYSPF